MNGRLVVVRPAGDGSEVPLPSEVRADWHPGSNNAVSSRPASWRARQNEVVNSQPVSWRR